MRTGQTIARYVSHLVTTAAGILVASLVAGCTHGARVATAPPCVAPSRVLYSVDSAVAVCAPPGFAVSPRTGAFLRPHGRTAAGEWLAIHLVPAASMDSADPWPVHLASDAACAADCASADSAIVHVDTVDGSPAHVETGLVSGGVAGFRRQPLLVVSWAAAGAMRGYATGYAESGAMLDTLRQMLRSARLAGHAR